MLFLLLSGFFWFFCIVHVTVLVFVVAIFAVSVAAVAFVVVLVFVTVVAAAAAVFYYYWYYYFCCNSEKYLLDSDASILPPHDVCGAGDFYFYFYFLEIPQHFIIWRTALHFPYLFTGVFQMICAQIVKAAFSKNNKRKKICCTILSVILYIFSFLYGTVVLPTKVCSY